MIVEIDRFLRRTGMTKSQLGRQALGDPHSIRRVTCGQREMSERTMGRLRRWMAEHPDGVLPAPRARRREGL